MSTSYNNRKNRLRKARKIEKEMQRKRRLAYEKLGQKVEDINKKQKEEV